MNYTEKLIVPGKRLGARAPRIDPRSLKLSKYIKALPAPPVNSGYVSAVPDWPMYSNDAIGDCAEAAAGHQIQQWTMYAGKPFKPTDGQIIDAYEGITGYNPNDPSTDQGTVIMDMLNFWRQQGIAGHKIVAFVSVDPTNVSEVQQAVYLFGGLIIGLALPVSAQIPPTGTNGLPVWLASGLTGPGAPGSWGGHCVPILGYGVDAQGNAGMEVATWAQLYDMTYAFLAAYGSEAWAIVTQDWIEADGKSPSGFDLGQLQADLAEVTA